MWAAGGGGVGGEARDIQGAVIEQVGVRGAVRRVEGAVGNELVDAPRCRIVAPVKGDAVVVVRHESHILVVETPPRGALRRRRQTAPRVVPDDPALMALGPRRVAIHVGQTGEASCRDSVCQTPQIPVGSASFKNKK